MTQERRARRSKVRHLALTYLLEAACERAQCSVAALMSADGLLIAGVGGDEATLETLGASRQPHWNEAPVHVRELTVEEQSLTLTTVGVRLDSAEFDAGVRRILLS